MRLKLAEDGVVTLFTGQMPHGQSHQTTLAQIAADEFGVPFEQVRVVAGDSDAVPFRFTGGMAAGRSWWPNGFSVPAAAYDRPCELCAGGTRGAGRVA